MAGVFVCILIACIIGTMAFASGRSYGRREATQELRIETVARGFAEWRVLPDGTTEFHWKKAKP